MAKKMISSGDFAPEMLSCDQYDIEKYIQPYWEGNIVYNEVVFPLTNEDGSYPAMTLMYAPTEILSVKSYSLMQTFEEGKDYILKDGKLYVTENSAIKMVPYSDIHPAENPDNLPVEVLYPHRDGKAFEYWIETNDLVRKCIAVTYVHNDSWNAPVPPSAADDLPITMSRLLNRDALSIVMTGDSVTAGAMASLKFLFPPYADAYPEMMLKALARRYGTDNISYINKAVGGTISSFTPEMLDKDILPYKPDLVVMAYGMNDSSIERKGLTDDEFRGNIRGRIEYIRKSFPNCEFLLIASVYGNTATFPAERYESHARILHEIAAETKGVAVCDPQEIERALLESGRKKFIDIMGDNMVHPNDFGMRLICQTVLAALSPKA